MEMVAYTVWARFDDASVRAEFRDWLQREHIGQVIDAGAAEADLLEHPASAEAPGGTIEVRYLFEGPKALADYLEHRMPRLRGETLKRFGHLPGIRYERVDARVVDRFASKSR